MNEYELTAQNYEAIMERDDLEISKEECISKIKLYRFLGRLTDAEIAELKYILDTS